MAIYKAAAGAGFNDNEAQKIGEILEDMGEFKPHDVVEMARPEDSELHHHFEWDDAKAAEEYRVDQARHLAGRINIVVKVADEKVETKAFHNVMVQTETGPEHRYVSFKIAVANPTMKRHILEELCRDLERLTEKYRTMEQAFGGVFKAMQRTVQTVRREMARQGIQPQAQA